LNAKTGRPNPRKGYMQTIEKVFEIGVTVSAAAALLNKTINNPKKK